MRITKPFAIASMVLALLAFGLATQLTIEKLDLLANAAYKPTCSINPFISCGPVMKSWQAAVFGIPNSIIGMVGFGLVALINFTALFTKLPRWYWGVYTGGITLAMGFIVWLMTQSMLVIHALCLYCFGVWLCVIPLFWLTLGNITRDTRFKFINDYKPLLIFVTYVALLFCAFLAFQQGWLGMLRSL